MRSNEVLPFIPKKEHSTRTEASESLGALSISSASIPLMLTFGLRGQIKEDPILYIGPEGFYPWSGGGVWIYVFGYCVFPLMLINFVMFIIGISLSSGTHKGKALNLIGLMLTLSPILMIYIIQRYFSM